jgi:protein ImuA
MPRSRMPQERPHAPARFPPTGGGGRAANDNAPAPVLRPARGLHRVEAAYQDLPAAAGFSLALLLTAAGPAGGAVLWAFSARAEREWGRPWGRGSLAGLGLDPGRLLLVRAGRDREVLWALEEGLRSGAGLAAVVGEAEGVAFAAQRRLALLASGRRLPAFLLTGADGAARGSPAAARWRVSARPSAPDPLDSHAPGPPRWRVDLLRYRAGPPGAWTLEWDREASRLRLASGVADRAVAAGLPPAPGAARVG